tara:strand:- start:1269 stop:2432 length:1164 start_codon:yes stop_codon:yes gene_type:complete
MTKSIKEKKSVESFSNDNSKNKKKIIVGLSGGVDSSLSAALLLESGWEVQGITLWLMKGQGSCCSEGLVDAAGLCEDLGINHHIIDSRTLFEKEVIEKTTEGYKSGITPLPCSMCNKNVKFEEMLGWAKNQKDFTYIATGHYARVKNINDIFIENTADIKFKDYLLLRGVDTNKDQSYFLYSLSQEVLRRLILPLGNFNKNETRTQAERLNLRTAKKEESQDLCLVEHYGSMQKFIDNHITNKEGDIKLLNGKIIGKHKGIQHFTVGQRKGLGIAWSEPLYVKELDQLNNIVYVACVDELMESEAIIESLNWVSIEKPSLAIQVDAQIRYRSKPVKGILEPFKIDNDEIKSYKLKFETKQSAITPGQAAVFYRGDILLGGGLIRSSG